MNIIEELDREQIAELAKQRSVPKFQAGDTVRVNVKVVEGDRSRIQAYEGVCIGRSGAGLHENFTVRKISYGEGVERVFPVHSPMIESIEVVRRGKVRRAKLYYLRGRRGKAARIPERIDARTKKKDVFKGFKRPKGEADDLKLIEGLNAEMERKLNKFGIIQFAQIANLSDDDIAKMDETLELDGAIERDDWVGQAVGLMAETTADEVPEQEEPEEVPAEQAAEAPTEEDSGEEEAPGEEVPSDDAPPETAEESAEAEKT